MGYDWFSFYSNERVKDLTGPDNGTAKFPRDGCWYNTSDDTPSITRGENIPD